VAGAVLAKARTVTDAIVGFNFVLGYDAPKIPKKLPSRIKALVLFLKRFLVNNSPKTKHQLRRCQNSWPSYHHPDENTESRQREQLQKQTTCYRQFRKGTTGKLNTLLPARNMSLKSEHKNKTGNNNLPKNSAHINDKNKPQRSANQALVVSVIPGPALLPLKAGRFY